MLVDVAKVVTGLGAFPTVLALVVATERAARGRAGAIRRRSCSLVGFALVYIAVHVTKEAIDRPRPDRVARARRPAQAFPSGHAAYATAWVAAAVVLTRRLRLVASGVARLRRDRDRGGGRR